MMAYNPSCARIFNTEVNKEIKKKIITIIKLLPNIKNQAEFNKEHENILNYIVTLHNKRKNNPKGEITYGQAQKGLNVFLKVYVDWANLPEFKIAKTIRKFLHCPLDNNVMTEIKKKERDLYNKYNNLPCTLKNIEKYNQYIEWQKLIDEIIHSKNSKQKRLIIDILWYLKRKKN